MTNHVHLEIKTINISISKIMKRINQICAQYFNKKYNYIGHLFQDRYHSEIIKDTAQMLTTTSYIHLNLVRASMVNRPEEYEYSSYSIYMGKKEDKLIYSERILSSFKDNNKRKLYQGFVESNIRLKEDVITVACALASIVDKLDLNNLINYFIRRHFILVNWIIQTLLEATFVAIINMFKIKIYIQIRKTWCKCKIYYPMFIILKY